MSVKKNLLPPLIPLLLLLVFWQLLVKAGVVRAYLLPAPSSIVATLVQDRGELWRAMFDTSLDAFTGFGMSAVLGIVVAVLLSSSAVVQRAFYPYAVFFQTVPLIAIAPLLVIWLGFGDPTVIGSAFISSLFPVIANTLAGILGTDPALRDLFRLYKATPMETLFKLRLPAALPQMFTGLRISAGLAVIGSIAGEFIAGGGLGSVVDVARTQQRTDKVFAAVLLASVLGLVLFGIVNLGGHLMLRRWHASEQIE